MPEKVRSTSDEEKQREEFGFPRMTSGLVDKAVTPSDEDARRRQPLHSCPRRSDHRPF